MEKVQLITRGFTFLLHIAATAVLVNWIGEYISQPTNILVVLAAGVMLSGLIVSMLVHGVALFNLFKKHTKTKDQ